MLMNVLTYVRHSSQSNTLVDSGPPPCIEDHSSGAAAVGQEISIHSKLGTAAA